MLSNRRSIWTQKSAKAWVVLAAYSDEAGQYDRAIEALQKALEIEPHTGRASLLYWLGTEYAAKADRTKAIEIYEELRKIDTKQADYLFRNYIQP